MGHVSLSDLRRLVDEPLAVSDTSRDHLAGCVRCRRAAARVAADASLVAGVLASGPSSASDQAGAPGAGIGTDPEVDLGTAWRGFEERAALAAAPGRSDERPRLPARPAPRRWRLAALSPPSPRLGGALAAGAAAVAAAVIATVVVPAGAPPAQASSPALTAMVKLSGIEGSGVLGDLPSPSGSQRLPFGTLAWSSARRAYPASSLAAAAAATGLSLRLPDVLPSGVGAPEEFLVQPEVTAIITFDSSAGPVLSGRTLRATVGPAALVEYGGSTAGLRIPTLAVFAMQPPTASSPGVPLGELQAILLSRPGLPSGFAQEIRAIRSVTAAISAHGLDSAGVQRVWVGGAPGLLVAADSGVASGVIWEDPAGTVHAAIGLVDQKDILDVANQIR